MDLSKLKNKHILSLLGNGIISLFSVATVSLLYRTLSKEDAGTWFFFLTVYGLSDALRNGFLSTATVKFYAGTPRSTGDAVLGSVWFLATVLTVSLCLLDATALFFIKQVKPEYGHIIKWMGITLLSSLPYTVTFWKLVADENYMVILWLRLINSGSMIISIAIFAACKIATLENIILINILTNILTSLVCIATKNSGITAWPSRTKEWESTLTNFGKFSLATNISSNLLGSANTFIIIYMLGPADYAVYNIPFRLMELVEIPLRTFVGTGMSTMATALNNNDMERLTYISKKYSGMLTLAFIPISIATFLAADLAITLIGGEKYINSPAPDILRIMMAVAVFYPIDRFNGVTLDIIHQPKINFHKVVIMSIVNIGGCFLGTLFLHNLYGAAIATPLTMVAGLTFGYYNLKKRLEGYSIRSILILGFAECKWFYLRLVSSKKDQKI